MNFRRVALLALVTALGAAYTACNNDNQQITNTAMQVNRFQALTTSTDTLLLDAATGDLWKLDENPGDEGARWVRYATAPTDVKSIDPDQVLHPPGPPEEQPAEPQDDQHEDQQDDGGDGDS